MYQQGAEELREKVASQRQELDALRKQAEEAKAATDKHLWEIEFLKKTEDNEAILLRLLRLQQVWSFWFSHIEVLPKGVTKLVKSMMAVGTWMTLSSSLMRC